MDDLTKRLNPSMIFRSACAKNMPLYILCLSRDA